MLPYTSLSGAGKSPSLQNARHFLSQAVPEQLVFAFGKTEVFKCATFLCFVERIRSIVFEIACEILE